MTAYSQVVTVAAVVGLTVWIIYAIRHKKSWYIAVGPLTYFSAVLILYIARIFNILTVTEQNLWSNVIRLLSEILFIVMGFILIKSNQDKTPWI